jgi:hypothetical protein
VQIGWIDVPPGVTSATQCTLHPAPGPLVPNNLQDLTTHIAASMASAVVHGFQATSAGGVEGTRLAQTDGNGNVGSAKTVQGISPTAPGGIVANSLPQTDSSGRVGDSERLGGVAASGYQAAGNYATLDVNSRVTDSEAVRGLRFTRGSLAVSVPANGSTGTVTCTLTDASFTPVEACIQVVGAPGFAITTSRVSLAAGSVSLQVFSDGSAWSGTVGVLAWG